MKNRSVQVYCGHCAMGLLATLTYVSERQVYTIDCPLCGHIEIETCEPEEDDDA